MAYPAAEPFTKETENRENKEADTVKEIKAGGVIDG